MELRNQHAYQAGANSGGLNTGGGFPMNIAPFYGGFGAFGGSSILESILLASVLGGGKGFFAHGNESLVGLSSLLAEKSSNDVRRDVKDSESEIKSGLHQNSVQFSQGINEVLSSLCGVGKDALASKFESIIANLISTNQLQSSIHGVQAGLDKKIDCETGQLKLQLFQIANEMQKGFCDNRVHTESLFGKLNETRLSDKIETLQRENFALNQNNQTASIASTLASMIASGNQSLIDRLSCMTLTAVPPCPPCPTNGNGHK